MHKRLTLIPFAIAATWLCDAAAAQSAEPATPKDASAPPTCIEVEVDGVRAPSYACLSERLRPTDGARPSTDAGLASEAITQRPGNQLGVFNRAATANRMGNTFGTSVLPQRPPAANSNVPKFQSTP